MRLDPLHLGVEAFVDAAFAGSGHVLAAARRRSRSPRRPPAAEVLGSAEGLSGQATLPCEAPVGAEGHAFRGFELRGRHLSIREELSSCEMPTGGRLWDAGLTLAHWLAKGEHPRLLRKSILELGSGCGLPGGKDDPGFPSGHATKRF